MRLEREQRRTRTHPDAIETALTGTGDVNWWLVGIAVALLAGGILAVKRWFTRMSRRVRLDEQRAHEPALPEPR